MQTDADRSQRQQARQPHNLFMLNLALFHLLMTPAAIVLGAGLLGMLLPLALSLATIAYTHLRSRRVCAASPWFVCLHWRLAMRNYRLLLIGYAITAALLALGWLLAAASSDPHMRNILHTVLVRIAVMPVLIMVMVNFYLESNAIAQASNGEIPDGLARRFPPADAARD